MPSFRVSPAIHLPGTSRMAYLGMPAWHKELITRKRLEKAMKSVSPVVSSGKGEHMMLGWCLSRADSPCLQCHLPAGSTVDLGKGLGKGAGNEKDGFNFLVKLGKRPPPASALGNHQEMY